MGVFHSCFGVSVVGEDEARVVQLFAICNHTVEYYYILYTATFTMVEPK